MNDPSSFFETLNTILNWPGLFIQLPTIEVFGCTENAKSENIRTANKKMIVMFFNLSIIVLFSNRLIKNG